MEPGSFFDIVAWSARSADLNGVLGTQLADVTF
jgi:hypothetical protein